MSSTLPFGAFFRGHKAALCSPRFLAFTCLTEITSVISKRVVGLTPHALAAGSLLVHYDAVPQ